MGSAPIRWGLRRIVWFTVGIIRCAWLIAAGLLAVLAFSGSPASAHAGVESSDPADGAVVDDPVSEITLVFTDETEPVGDGFRVVEANGVVRAPARWESSDGRRFVLQFDPPITGGQISVRWTIRSADSHALSGGIGFTVNASVSASSDPVGDTPASAVESGGSDADATPSRAETATEAESERGAALGQPVERPLIESVAVAVPGSISEVELREPVAVRALALAGRLASMLGALIAIGAVVFLIVVLRGTPHEGRLVTFIARGAALVLVGGAIAQATAFVASPGEAWGSLLSPVEWIDALSSRFGGAIALQLIGAFGISTGSLFRREPIGQHSSEASRADLNRVGVLAAGSGLSAIADRPPADHGGHDEASLAPLLFRWHPTSASSGAVLGIVSVLAAFVVDGHTLGGSSPMLSAVVTLTHVVAGSVWVGGVLVLFCILNHRLREDRRVEAVDLAVRYSVLATLSLAAVALAGLVLTYSHVDSVSDVWTTGWGRLVLAKLGLVAVVAAIGALNHFVVIPRLVTRSNDTGLGVALKRLIAAEIVVLVMVVALSAQLVATGL